MKKTVVKPSPSKEVESSFYQQSSSLTYKVLEHQENERESIDLDSNNLTFSSKHFEKKFRLTLYGEKPGFDKPSAEFKSNLMVFYIFLCGFLGISVIFSVLRHSEGDISDAVLTGTILSSGFVFFIGILILVCVLSVPFCLLYNRELYFVLGLVISTHIVLTDERVLNGIVGEDLKLGYLLGSFLLSCFLAMFRVVLFESFIYILALTVFGTLLNLGMHLGFSSLHYYYFMNEFLITLAFNFLLVVEARKSEYRARQLFWRKEKKEDSQKPNNTDNVVSVSPNINSEIEQIMEMCDDVKKTIKSAISIIMFKDVKDELKKATKNIEKIKKCIGHGTNLHVKFNKTDQIDEQDKAFISQMFMEVSLDSAERSEATRTVMKEIYERTPSFPFSSYGVDKLESVLAGVGKNWNFDIWFVYEATGQSIFIIAKYLGQKWGLIKSFGIPDSVFDTYFQRLEKVSFM